MIIMLYIMKNNKIEEIHGWSLNSSNPVLFSMRRLPFLIYLSLSLSPSPSLSLPLCFSFSLPLPLSLYLSLSLSLSFPLFVSLSVFLSLTFELYFCLTLSEAARQELDTFDGLSVGLRQTGRGIATRYNIAAAGLRAASLVSSRLS